MEAKQRWNVSWVPWSSFLFLFVLKGIKIIAECLQWEKATHKIALAAKIPVGGDTSLVCVVCVCTCSQKHTLSTVKTPENKW